MNEKSTTKELVVRKSNQLIEASYRFGSISEARIIQLLLTKINAYDKDLKVYEISVAEFAAIFDIKDDRLHSKIKQHLSNLTRRVISIEKQTGWLIMSWLSSAEYVKGRGIVELCFDAKLKPYLIELKTRYTQFSIDDIINFTSIYAIRFFEFIKENQFKADENGLFQITFEYMKLRKLFEIEDKEYKFFADFKKKAIEPAVTEINAKTNFAVEVSYGKTGRAITHITFDCADKTKKKPVAPVSKIVKKAVEAEDVKPKEDKSSEIKRLIAFGITDKTAAMWLKKYGKEKLVRNLDYVDAKLKSGASINDVKAYLAEAIKSDYGFQTVEEQVVTIQEKEISTERKTIEDEAKAFIGKTFANPTKPELKYIVNNQNFFSVESKKDGSTSCIQITRKFLDNIKNGVLIELGK
jgi:plasmid replication initiation protein